MKKNCIVTGGCGAIGKAIARGLAQQGYQVFITSRDPDKARETVLELKTLTNNHSVHALEVDLGVQSSIVSLATHWKDPLYLLINNAAAAPKRRSETTDCIETQWAVNVLGYYHMIRLFSPFMQAVPGARIVNVASYWAGDLDMEDPEFRIRPYDNDIAYRQSKQADRMLTAIWAEKLRQFGIVVNCCHPGDVNSRLSNDLGFGGQVTPEEGAQTPLWLALSEDAGKVTGCYAENQAFTEDAFTQNKNELEQLKFVLRSYITH